jgi:hypothetical protein
MRNHTCARLQLAIQFGKELEIEERGEIEGYHRRRADVGLEQIGCLKPDLAGDTGLPGVVLCFADQGRVQVDADATCTIDARRRDRDAPVA